MSGGGFLFIQVMEGVRGKANGPLQKMYLLILL